ncbi:serine/arginine repetitive matrix protein 2-like [Anthonomus grandis grandis]|uniref:serine/arginine repetitive matrix protein 2-like n=1 Tax=Anthonomus grandis grandis TaxID=2921223 RepID=UPI002165F8B7|nr:serine/arginine repetitive matrix protein 2-like [Anthonomus grandis grandis]
MSSFLCSSIPEDKMLSYIYDDVDDSDVFALEPNIKGSENNDKGSEKIDNQTAPSYEVLKENEVLKETIKKLSQEKDLLERRISEVYKTAKAELERRDRRVRELNEEKNNLLFRRNPVGFRNRQHFNKPDHSRKENEVNTLPTLPTDSGKIDLRKKISHASPKPNLKKHQDIQTDLGTTNKPIQSPTTQNLTTVYSERVSRLKTTGDNVTSIESSSDTTKIIFKKDKLKQSHETSSKIESMTHELQSTNEIVIEDEPIIKEVPKVNMGSETENTGVINKDASLELKVVKSLNQVDLQIKSQEVVENNHKPIEEGIEDRNLTNEEFQRFDCMKYKIPKKKTNNDDKLLSHDNNVTQKSILTRPYLDNEKNARNCDKNPCTNKKNKITLLNQNRQINTQEHGSKSRSKHEKILTHSSESKSPGREKGKLRKNEDHTSKLARSEQVSKVSRSRSKSTDNKNPRDKTPIRDHKNSEQPKSYKETNIRTKSKETSKTASRSPSIHQLERSRTRSLSSPGTRHKEDRRSESSSSTCESTNGRRKNRLHSRDRRGTNSPENEGTHSYRSRQKINENARRKESKHSSREGRLSPKCSEHPRTKKPPRTPPGSPPREPNRDRADRKEKYVFRQHERRSRSKSCDRVKHRRSNSKENNFSARNRGFDHYRNRRFQQTRTRNRSPEWPSRLNRQRDRRGFSERAAKNGRIHRQSVGRDSSAGFNRKVVQSRLRERETRREMLREAYRARNESSFDLTDHAKGYKSDEPMLEIENLSTSKMDEEALERLLAEKRKLLEQDSKIGTNLKSDTESGELTDDDDNESPRIQSKVEKRENKRKPKLPKDKKEPAKKNIKHSESIDLKWETIGGKSVNNYRNLVDVKQERNNEDKNLLSTRDENRGLKETNNKQENKSRYDKYISVENKQKDLQKDSNTNEENLSYEEIFTKAQMVKKECLAFELIKNEKIHVKMKECIEPFTKEDAESVNNMAKFLKKATEIFVFEDIAPPNTSIPVTGTATQPLIEKKKIGLDAYKKRRRSTIENPQENKEESEFYDGSKKISEAKSEESEQKELDNNLCEISKDNTEPLPGLVTIDPPHGDSIVENNEKQTSEEDSLRYRSPPINQAQITYKDSNSFLQDFDLSDDEEPLEEPIESKANKVPKINIIDISIIKPGAPPQAAIQEEVKQLHSTHDIECIEHIQEAVYGITGQKTLKSIDKSKDVLNTEELERCLEDEASSECQIAQAQLSRKQAGSVLSEKTSADVEYQIPGTPEKDIVNPLKNTREKLIDIFGSPLSSCSPLAPKTNKELEHPAAKVKRNITKKLLKATKSRSKIKNLTADEVLLQQVQRAEPEHSQSLNTEKIAPEQIQKHFAFFNSPCHIPPMPFPQKSIEDHTNKCNQAKATLCTQSDSESSTDSSEPTPIKPVASKRKKTEKKGKKIKIKMSFGAQPNKHKNSDESPEKVQKKRKNVASKRTTKSKENKTSKKAENNKVSTLKSNKKADSDIVKPRVEKTAFIEDNSGIKTSEEKTISTPEESSPNTPNNKNSEGNLETIKSLTEGDQSDVSNIRRSIRTKKPSVKTPKRITPLKVGEIDKTGNMLGNIETGKRKGDNDLEGVPNTKVAKLGKELPQIMETYINIQKTDSQLSSLTKIQQMSEDILNKSSDALPKTETDSKSPFKIPFDLSLQDESFSHIKTIHIEESSTLMNMFDSDLQQLMNLGPNSDKSFFSNEEKKGDSPKGPSQMTNFVNCLDKNVKAFTSTPIKVLTKCDPREKVLQQSVAVATTSCSSSTGVTSDVNATVDNAKNYFSKPLKRDRRKKVATVLIDMT